MKVTTVTNGLWSAWFMFDSINYSLTNDSNGAHNPILHCGNVQNYLVPSPNVTILLLLNSRPYVMDDY